MKLPELRTIIEYKAVEKQVQAYCKTLEHVNLSTEEFSLLGCLYSLNSETRQQELQLMLNLRAPVMTKYVKHLKKLGFIATRRNPNNKKEKLIRIHKEREVQVINLMTAFRERSTHEFQTG